MYIYGYSPYFSLLFITLKLFIIAMFALSYMDLRWRAFALFTIQNLKKYGFLWHKNNMHIECSVLLLQNGVN